MTKLITIYWRDIPSQVIAKQGRKSVKIQLSNRFQLCIDKAAMRAGRQGSEEYLNDWRREYHTISTTELEKAAKQNSDQLEAEYSDARLQQLGKSKGVDPVKQIECPPSLE